MRLTVCKRIFFISACNSSIYANQRPTDSYELFSRNHSTAVITSLEPQLTPVNYCICYPTFFVICLIFPYLRSFPFYRLTRDSMPRKLRIRTTASSEADNGRQTSQSRLQSVLRNIEQLSELQRIMLKCDLQTGGGSVAGGKKIAGNRSQSDGESIVTGPSSRGECRAGRAWLRCRYRHRRRRRRRAGGLQAGCVRGSGLR